MDSNQKKYEKFPNSGHRRSVEYSCSHRRWLDGETTDEHQQELVEWVATVTTVMGTKTPMQQC